MDIKKFDISIHLGGTSDVVLYVPCFGVGFCTVSPSVCLDDVYFGLPYYMLSLYCD